MDGIHENDKYRDLESFSEPVDNIYLTKAELRKIFKLDLTQRPELDVYRDLLLLGCLLAQRISDWSITVDNIVTLENKKFVQVIQKKTGKKVKIPITPELEKLLVKYDFNPPNKPDQKINEYIKVIGKMAGITDTIQIKETQGGITRTVLYKKYEKITSHTARRTGCTLMFLSGIPQMEIMAVSGHTSEKTFRDYIKADEDEMAIKLSKHDYYKNGILSIAE